MRGARGLVAGTETDIWYLCLILLEACKSHSPRRPASHRTAPCVHLGGGSPGPLASLELRRRRHKKSNYRVGASTGKRPAIKIVLYSLVTLVVSAGSGGPQAVHHDSRLTSHDSLTSHESRLTHDSRRVTTHDSRRVTTHDSRVATY